MNGEERDGIKVGVNIGRRRIIPRLTELFEIAHQKWSTVKFQQAATGAHHIKEASDVADPLVGLWRCLASQFSKES